MLTARPKLSDVITEKLESMILDGSWLAGEQLPSERELATEFAVSRTSLREPIQNLQARGLVTRKQGGGTFVSAKLNTAMTDPLLALVAERPETQFDLSPQYATYSTVESKFMWRPVLPIGVYDTANNGVDYPYLNDAHYPYQELEFTLKPIRPVL